MLKDMESVFAQADATALLFHQRIETERLSREAAAKDIVAGLGGGASKEGESIESILASIVDNADKSA